MAEGIKRRSRSKAIEALPPPVNDPTTAVEALDQIEDLQRRLERRQLDAGYARDAAGKMRVTFPVPTWQDYLGCRLTKSGSSAHPRSRSAGV
jgi:uncharacterized membrane protein